MQTILRVLVKINRENFSLLKKQEKLIKKVKNKNKGLNKNTNLRHRKIKQIQKLNTKKKVISKPLYEPLVTKQFKGKDHKITNSNKFLVNDVD